MRFRCSYLSLLVLLAAAGSARAFDTVGKIKKVDAEKRTIHIHANGRDHSAKTADDVKILDASGNELKDGLRSKELKEDAEVTVTVELVEGRPTIKVIRLGRHVLAEPAAITGKASVGLMPLNEMGADDTYKGEDGGLYGRGRNDPPEDHQAAARAETERIVPLDRDGKPSTDGRIGLISISMSNATQEFSEFKKIADSDPDKSPRLTIVDCAQGGQAMGQWVDPNARPWAVALERLEKAGVSPRQVQVAWIKLANVAPKGDLEKHGKKLQRDTIAVLHNARERFPNLRIAYLGSRIYAGYAGTQLNPEPYAYESAFVVRWLIQDQIKGDKGLNYDPARGPVISPLLLWGPYLWGDGLTPRKADGLVWTREDLGPDGTHPSESGRKKVADLLLKFFKTDPNARTWFVR
jgi:hypothetical protein